MPMGIVQVTVLVAGAKPHPPIGPLAVPNVTPAGRLSVTVIAPPFVPDGGPASLFVTKSVYCRLLPTVTGSGESDLVIMTSLVAAMAEGARAKAEPMRSAANVPTLSPVRRLNVAAIDLCSSVDRNRPESGDS